MRFSESTALTILILSPALQRVRISHKGRGQVRKGHSAATPRSPPLIFASTNKTFVRKLSDRSETLSVTSSLRESA